MTNAGERDLRAGERWIGVGSGASTQGLKRFSVVERARRDCCEAGPFVAALKVRRV